MKFSHVLLIAIFFAAGLFTISSIAQSNSTQVTQRQSNQPRFEYGTLTTQVSEGENGQFVLTWNEGVEDFVGRSRNSLSDAQRRLTALIGRGNSTQTNLSVLLTSLGQRGWRLVESNENESGSIRIFVRAQ